MKIRRFFESEEQVDISPERVAEIVLWRQLPKNNRETIMAEIGKFTNQ